MMFNVKIAFLRTRGIKMSSKFKIPLRAVRNLILYIIRGKTALEKNLGLASILSIIFSLIYLIYWFVAGTFWNKYTSLMFICFFYAIFLLFLRFKCEILSRELREKVAEEAKRLKLTEKDTFSYLQAKKEIDIANDWFWITIGFLIISLLILSFPG